MKNCRAKSTRHCVCFIKVVAAAAVQIKLAENSMNAARFIHNLNLSKHVLFIKSFVWFVVPCSAFAFETVPKCQNANKEQILLKSVNHRRCNWYNDALSPFFDKFDKFIVLTSLSLTYFRSVVRYLTIVTRFATETWTAEGKKNNFHKNLSLWFIQQLSDLRKIAFKVLS